VTPEHFSGRRDRPARPGRHVATQHKSPAPSLISADGAGNAGGAVAF
jgi:hypothetical protein